MSNEPEEQMTPEEKIMMDQLEASAGQTGKDVVGAVDFSEVHDTRKPDSPKSEKDLNLNMILDIPVDLHVELGNAELPIKDVLKMGPGSVIELDRLAGSPADIIVNGKLIGQGDVVVVNENFGIRITKLVDPEQRIESF